MRIHTINEAVEPISNILHENGASGVVIEDPLDLIKERDTFFGEIYELNPAEYPEEGIFIKAYLAMNASFDQTVEVIKQSINKLPRSEEHTSELQSRGHLVCRLLLEKKK